MRSFRAALPGVALVAVLTLAAPAAAADVLRGRALGPAAGHVLADGRYAAYLETATRLRVIDSRTGGDVTIELPGRCTVPSIGGGLVLAVCPDAPHLFSAATGAEVALAGWDAVLERAQREGFSVGPKAIGRRWMAVWAGRPQIGITWYLNWRDGTIADEPTEADRAPDLDVSPSTSLCRPLRRTPRPRDIPPGDPFLPFFVTGSWGASASVHVLELQRCGSREVTELPCPMCAFAQLDAGALSYVTGSGPRLRLLRCAREWAVRWPHHADGSFAAVAHTGRHVYASVARRRPDGTVRITVFRAARPTCAD